MVATPSVDNSEWVMQGVVRDPITGALLRVNADGSINVSGGGAGGGAGTGFTSATTAGTALVGTLGTNGLSVGVPAWLTTAGTAANSNNIGTNTAFTNVTATANSSGLSINAAGYAGTGTTFGTTAGTVPAATLNSNGLSFLNPEPIISSYENFVPGNFISQTLNGASISHAVAFQLPQQISVSFLRMPILLTTNSTTLATTGASLSASVQVFTTFNAVVYSLGTGANSQSLQFVASGSAGFTMLNSISVAANGTQYSITQAFTFPALGANTSTQSTQYSISNTNYSFSSAIFTVFSSERFFDIPFPNSLSAGPYWLIVGYSSSSNTNSTGISAASNAVVGYSQHHAQSVVNVGNWGIMGSTNLASGGGLGNGSFSTVGGGTTNSLPLSAISSSGSFPRFYFQLLRSA